MRRRSRLHHRLWVILLLLGLVEPGYAASIDDLIRAYPDFLTGFDGVSIIWRDGTRMAVGETAPGRTPEEVLQHGAIRDQLALPYPAGAPLLPPRDDPGRVRNQAFFDKMYGDCMAGQVAPKMVRIVWLPKTWGHSVSITSVNGLDRRLEAVSRELDDLPMEDKKFLYPIGGTYNCRHVAGTDRMSMHAWGAAIDMTTGFSDYWRWARPDGDPPAYRKRLPPEIVAVFERHGFIWGGRWSHFDTMHFEYRPELLEYSPLTTVLNDVFRRGVGS